MYDLTSASEQQFAYNIEVLGLSVERAGVLAGVPSPVTLAKRPDVLRLRRAYRRDVIKRADMTKEDIIVGIRDAIDDAKILADPTAQIKGYTEIAKLLDMYAPKRVELVDGSGFSSQVKNMPTRELLQLADEARTIDVDFIEVEAKDTDE